MSSCFLFKRYYFFILFVVQALISYKFDLGGLLMTFVSRRYLLTGLLFGGAIISFNTYANNQTSTDVKEFSLRLDRSRVILDKEVKGALLTVKNPHSYPILVQSRIIDEDKQTKTRKLLATPPLFRLNEGQNSKLRVYSNDLSSLPQDRETLFWLCTKGIPPTDEDVWAEENSEALKKSKATLGVNLAIEGCIKLIYRPENISPVNYDNGNEIQWSKDNGLLKAYNPTPNYQNIKKLIINKKEVEKPDYIPPFGLVEYKINTEGKIELEWSIITDLGGEGKTHNEIIK
ncbi:fimbria/pilus periplasmic chaperone [Escherichia coli]|uniref:fimbria/pilus periplasmic chaperone n=1 Tax=Escherichia coli TaxID=562 RepID=UPI0011EA2AF8|nr:fimbria/pilus periplasmic chaperone [Escherichia coli]EEQ8256207.1 fimbria/pilus periplasmic chaperone [Escherichia coli]EER2721403.1 fimbria/pilus periplasmic chaperone [Escherichia coli]EER5333787.1 fimbria/pilus periplasmic chaperone [Escherichia coli]EER7108989.1 fimbria/pilus periplasmic chaperone [Escherichia coli]EER9091761.1 fimbria/pilus periplasmic chaperone [Escherichia coli]